MKSVIKLAIPLGLAITVFAHPALAATMEEIAARLDALEKENAALKQRLKRVETAAPTSRAALPPAGQPAGLGALGGGTTVLDARAQDTGTPQVYKSPVGIGPPTPLRHYEISGSLLYLQPGSGDLEYATLVSPFPLPTPNWANQSLKPDYTPTFRFGLRYIPTVFNDIQLNWTHLDASATASVVGTPGQMVGPPFEIGPTASVYQVGRGNVSFKYDLVNLDAGHTFCAECFFQLRVFGGAEFARINQNLTGSFLEPGRPYDRIKHHQFDVYRRRAATGTERPVRRRRLSILRRGCGGRVDRHCAELHQFFSHLHSGARPRPAQQPGSDIAQRNPGGSELRRQVRHGLRFSAQQLRTIKDRIGLSGGDIHEYRQSVCADPSIGSSRPCKCGVFLATAQHLQNTFTTQGPYVTASWAF